MFTALATDLVGLGMPPAQALFLGCEIKYVSAAGTTQGAGTVIGNGSNQIALVTSDSTNNAVTISNNVPVGAGIVVFANRSSATAIYPAQVFPPSGCTIDDLSANAAFNVNVNDGVYIYRSTATVFEVLRLPCATMLQTTATCTGTTQGAGVSVAPNRTYLLTTSAGQTAATISSAMPIGSVLEAHCITATTALLFPPTGCTIDQGSANASVNIAQNKGRIIRRTGATTFHTILSA
jgi:hypothetical protein